MGKNRDLHLEMIDLLKQLLQELKELKEKQASPVITVSPINPNPQPNLPLNPPWQPLPWKGPDPLPIQVEAYGCGTPSPFIYTDGAIQTGKSK